MTRLFRAELLKQRTTPAFLIGAALVPVAASLVAVAVFGAAGKQGNAPLGADSLAQVIGAPAPVITLIALVLGILGMAGEYRHQTITTTFLASPRRRDVVVAKLAACAIAGAAMGVASVAVSVGVGVPWLQSADVAVRVNADVLAVTAAVVASSALFGALGVSVGALVRNQTAAVSAALVWLLAVEGIVGDVLAGAAILRWLPAAVGRDLVLAGGASGGLSAPLAAAVFGAYVAAFALAATRFTLRRDIA